MKEIINVKPLQDYKLLLTFNNDEKRIKDMNHKRIQIKNI